MTLAVGTNATVSSSAAGVSLEDAAAEIRARLNAAREAISRELCAIPPPVPACDVHFNRLLEDRARIVDEIQRFAALAKHSMGVADLLSCCRESVWLEPEFKAWVERALAGERFT